MGVNLAERQLIIYANYEYMTDIGEISPILHFMSRKMLLMWIGRQMQAETLGRSIVSLSFRSVAI